MTEHLNVSPADKDAWYAYWVDVGFESLEKMIADDGGWCVGHSPTMADCYLVPQVANARRMKIDLVAYPRIMRIDELAASHPAIIQAAPQLQPDYIAP